MSENKVKKPELLFPEVDRQSDQYKKLRKRKLSSVSYSPGAVKKRFEESQKKKLELAVLHDQEKIDAKYTIEMDRAQEKKNKAKAQKTKAEISYRKASAKVKTVKTDMMEQSYLQFHYNDEKQKPLDKEDQESEDDKMDDFIVYESSEEIYAVIVDMKEKGLNTARLEEEYVLAKLAEQKARKESNEPPKQASKEVPKEASKGDEVKVEPKEVPKGNEVKYEKDGKEDDDIKINKKSKKQDQSSPEDQEADMDTRSDSSDDTSLAKRMEKTTVTQDDESENPNNDESENPNSVLRKVWRERVETMLSENVQVPLDAWKLAKFRKKDVENLKKKFPHVVVPDLSRQVVTL